MTALWSSSLSFLPLSRLRRDAPRLPLLPLLRGDRLAARLLAERSRCRCRYRQRRRRVGLWLWPAGLLPGRQRLRGVGHGDVWNVLPLGGGHLDKQDVVHCGCLQKKWLLHHNNSQSRPLTFSKMSTGILSDWILYVNYTSLLMTQWMHNSVLFFVSVH